MGLFSTSSAKGSFGGSLASFFLIVGSVCLLGATGRFGKLFLGASNGEFLSSGSPGSRTGPRGPLILFQGFEPTPGIGENFLFIGSARPANGSFDLGTLGI